MDRVQLAMLGAAEAGLHVVSTWPTVVADVGSANPRDVSRLQALRWSQVDLDEVLVADVVWFLTPSPGHSTRGAWVEWGVAWQAGKLIVASGDTRQSIFTALGIEHETDEAALAFLLTVKERTGDVQSGRQFDTSDIHSNPGEVGNPGLSETATLSESATQDCHAAQAFSATCVVKR